MLAPKWIVLLCALVAVTVNMYIGKLDTTSYSSSDMEAPPILKTDLMDIETLQVLEDYSNENNDDFDGEHEQGTKATQTSPDRSEGEEEAEAHLQEANETPAKSTKQKPSTASTKEKFPIHKIYWHKKNQHLNLASKATEENPFVVESHYNKGSTPIHSMFFGPAKPYFPEETTEADKKNDLRLVYPTQNATEAVCTLRANRIKTLPSKNKPKHFELPHNFHQLIRCFSWWQLAANKDKQPVLFVEKYYGLTQEDDELGHWETIHAYYKALQDVFGVRLDIENRTLDTPSVLVEAPWRESAIYVTQSPEHAKALVEGILNHYTPNNPSKAGCYNTNGHKRTKPVIGYLDRQDATKRKVANYKDILNRLEQIRDEDGDAFLLRYQQSFSGMSLFEQIRFMSETDILIGPHGAQFTTSLYLPVCGSLFEFFPPKYWAPQWFGSMVAMRGNDHFFTYNGEKVNLNEGRDIQEYNVSVDAVEQVTHIMLERWQSCCAKQEQQQKQ